MKAFNWLEIIIVYFFMVLLRKIFIIALKNCRNNTYINICIKCSKKNINSILYSIYMRFQMNW